MYSHRFISSMVPAARKSKAVGHTSVTPVPLLFMSSGLPGPSPRHLPALYCSPGTHVARQSPFYVLCVLADNLGLDQRLQGQGVHSSTYTEFALPPLLFLPSCSEPGIIPSVSYSTV